MSKKKEFDWNEFNKIGDEFLNNKNPGKQRTGISRYYYGSFCSSRDFINKNKTYLGKKSKERMTTKNADTHGETAKIFKHHKKYKKDNKGKIISKNLNKLRKMRNKADYDKIINGSLSDMIKNSKILSEKILDLLEELN